MRDNWGLLLLIGIGAFLRLWQLGRASYQIDELATMQMWQQDQTVGDIFDHALRDLHWNHRMVVVPLINMWVMQHGSYGTALPPEWMSRLPHAIMGIFTIPLFWLLGRSLGGRASAWWSGLLGTFSVFAVYYAREAYDYSSLIFFSAGVSWTGIEILNRRLGGGKRIPSSLVLGYILFSTGLLMSHLSGFLFLVSFLVAAGLAVWRKHGRSIFQMSREITFWAICFAPAFVFFLPFLFKLAGGFTNVDASSTVRRFSLAVIPAVIGRMGWGEGVIPLSLFILVAAVGVVICFRSKGQIAPAGACPWVGVVAVLLYFVLQSWSLRVARMEIRYYAPMFPFLLATAAVGLDAVVRLCSAVRPSIKPTIVAAVMAMALLGWLAPSLLAVCNLDTRGYNYKSIARWINEHVPEDGVYAFYNVYELRGVPNVYPTPGRNGTSVAAWSSGEDFKRINPPARAQSLFTRFPQIVFVEIMPEDLFGLRPTAPIDRDRLFMRHEWIGDPAADLLFRLKTHPMGDVQIGNALMHRVLVSYNLPEDFPELARKSGNPFYHRFGAGWRYVNDQAFNHWLAVQDRAELVVGNTLPSVAAADIRLLVISPAAGCRLRVADSSGNIVATSDIGSQGLSEIKLPAQLLRPGETIYRLSVASSSAGAPAAALLYSIDAVPAGATRN